MFDTENCKSLMNSLYPISAPCRLPHITHFHTEYEDVETRDPEVQTTVRGLEQTLKQTNVKRYAFKFYNTGEDVDFQGMSSLPSCKHYKNKK